LLTLVVLSVIIHIITGRPHGLINLLASRVLLILPVAGIAHEVIRFSGKHQNNRWVRLLSKPNLALQGLTTREPDHQMLEVAIAALERVLAAEQNAGQVVTSVEAEPIPVEVAAAVPSAD
jgi:uncharacterized protein YqhQ